ncbi:hypothetical protein I5G86_gp14 [Mycobacterium phage DarthP]|uniref:Uncharacterized protein n=2 Tax=Amginevirus TaxID=2946794 RepID=A0A222ZPM0_9CAUD|nr:hypothetical protein I5G85_gp14 [Mycobacterium phage Amohnition]YP_009952043.1 hypothetical protein I5G86_gp14 [Mycobacterium phage DarthP]ASR86365.1 hypothetical protein SEA_AMOHNITION_85 [Mycobacterium phage Amohnition]ASW31831.1 hypothetical protein SEA_DARTHP_85 [Mycobacterium phage DarthP]
MGESALFLDGPLAGQTREVPTWRDGGLNDVFYVQRAPAAAVWDKSGDPHDVLRPDVVTYRRKPNRLSHGPRWAYALGEKVGDQVVCVFPYSREAVDAMGQEALDEMVRREAQRALERICGSVGLVPVDVMEVFRGTRGEAREAMYRGGVDGQMHGGAQRAVSACESLGDGPYLEGVTFVVHEAVAMPAAVAA